MSAIKKIIAVVDDEPDLLELLSHNLKKSGYTVKTFTTASGFRRSLKKSRPDLIILDLMLPDMNGFDVCRQLKKNEETASIPVIMLTAMTDETDKVTGLELGADDYVTKPFSIKELVARVRVIFRRIDKSEKQDSDTLSLTDALKLDLNKYKVFVEKRPVDLTTTEFRILHLLSEKPGWVYSREQIMDYLWGDEKAILDRTIDVHIRNLRKKLGKAGKHIKNVRGIGYKFE